ncbi:MAG TPA: OAM dimerization domain-containing protein, partial [Myxococcaceae bacterium]|nr:OAM dimerization domain-containing protein [Myxococcaceae bacterium]
MATPKAREIIRPYGDRKDDGVVQLSFTLPVPLSEKAREAALQFTRKLGFSDVKVAAAERAADNYTFFIVYARSGMYLDYSEIEVPEVVVKKLGFAELNHLIEEKLRRRIVVVGACTGTDTHTVGIDAILNMKGYAGDYGLERYPWFEAYNFGSQVPNEELIRRAREKKAVAILVSQVVTQRDVHKENARQFIEEAKRQGAHGRIILLLGGPRVDHKLALELG